MNPSLRAAGACTRRARTRHGAACLALVRSGVRGQPARQQRHRQDRRRRRSTTLPNNEPHVGCDFQVDFYGYDEGDLFADVTFDAHPPTGPGPDAVDRHRVHRRGRQQRRRRPRPAWTPRQTYILDFGSIEPHPVQGFHVKLTVNADGSQGADVKHKVFWVTGCDVPPPPV